MKLDDDQLKGIAIVGMAGRFPGANDVDGFWQNLCNGVESISFFSDEEVLETGVDPQLLKHPDYVKAWGIMDDVDKFDANYFGIPGREAEAMDPQHRHFLEVCVHALEDSGYNPETYEGLIGLVCGVGISTYLLRNLTPNAERLQALGEYLTFIGNDKDFMGTRVAYKLNLRGGVHSVSTACSTTLVGVHLACRQLLTYETDMAIAGGANIKLPQKSGYLYRKGHLKSSDGHCHAFSKGANGTVFGNGVAAVVLKRASEAYEDGDQIYGIIRASALNNDGNSKAGYTAPSISGQTGAIMQAHELSGFEPETITHMEAHGTGTELGDPCEVNALNRVFRRNGGDKKQYCALTSVKTNVGHLDNVGGVAGLIKLAKTIKEKKIPPSLNFTEPNPEIDFENSPFYVNTELKEWEANPNHPRRACISAFGAGGTNAHAVLQEAPELPESAAMKDFTLLTLSAKSTSALDNVTANLLNHIKDNPEKKLSDVAFTMNSGRINHFHRRTVVFSNREELLEALANPADSALVRTANLTAEGEARSKEAADVVGTLADASGEALKGKLEGLAEMWVTGATIDWLDFYEGSFHHRLSLPLYPFESVRYWIDMPKGLAFASEEIAGPKDSKMVNPMEKKPLDEWFYEPTWRSASLFGEKVDDAGKCWVVFSDATGVGEAVVAELKAQGKEVVLVTTDTEFSKPNDDHYVIDPFDANHYNGILTEMTSLKRVPAGIIHAFSVSANEAEDQDVDMGFMSFIYLSQAIQAQAYDHNIQVLAVSNRAHKVMSDDNMSPTKSMLMAPVRVVPQEHPHIRCKALDIVLGDNAANAKAIVAEAQTPTDETVAALRHGMRWLPHWEKLALQEVGEKHPRLRDGGTYLVTGGMGGMGFVLAEYLATKAGATLILTGRSPVPPKEAWEEVLASGATEAPGYRAVGKLKYLEEKGAKVAYYQADVTDEAALKHAVEEAEAAHGTINGVVHAAGLAEVGMILHKTKEAAQHVLAPKVDGTNALAKVFEGRDLDFILMTSSLAAAVGGYAQVAYSAANAYQDAFAQKHADRNFVALNWDAWKDVGMAVNRQTEDLMLKGISNVEGVEAFGRVLASGMTQVAVSTHDWIERIRQSREFAMDSVEALADLEGAKVSYPRPEISVPYKEPSSELEKLLCRDWQHILGLDKVGVNDDFFELGGDSLKGMNVINALEKRLGGIFHIEALFDTSTVSGLAEYLEDEHSEAVERLLSGAEPVATVREEAIVPITSEMLADFQSRNQPLPARESTTSTKNRPAVFVLAPPRSGSTLLRVMLAGHPDLVAPPELFMLSFNSVKEREAAFDGQAAFWKDGLIQALMVIKDCAEPHARSIVEDFEARDATVKELYQHLQDLLGEKQMLVDKTPSYAYHESIMRRAEEDFHEPLYIHLQRHPHAMINSFHEANLDVPLRHYLGGDLPYNSRQIAEMIWLMSHNNINNFLKDVPAERQLAVRFEDLVSSPEESVRKMCEFLKVDFSDEMLNPYLEQFSRMTEGINHEARMLGDVKFHNFKKIEASVAEAWRENVSEDWLNDETWSVAEGLGYKRDIDGADELAGLDEADIDNMSEEDLDAMLSQMDDE